MDQTRLHMLLLQDRDGTISEEDKFVLEQILQHSQQARDLKAFVQADTTPPVDPSAAWKTLGDVTRRRRRNYRLAVGAATTMLVGAVIGGFYWLNRPQNNPPLAIVEELSLTNAAGQIISLDTNGVTVMGRSRVTATSGRIQINGVSTDTILRTLRVPPAKRVSVDLSDGSIITINSNTNLKLPLHFSRKHRSVTITGEAFFDVAKDTTAPFVVLTPNEEITVTGTRFNVNCNQLGKTEVALLEGSVQVRVSGKLYTLSAGEKLVIFGLEIKKQSVDSTYDIAWIDGRYNFLSPTVAQIADVLYRWFGVELTSSLPPQQVLPIRGLIDNRLSLAENITHLNALGVYRLELLDDRTVSLSKK